MRSKDVIVWYTTSLCIALKTCHFLLTKSVGVGQLWQVFVGAKERRVPGHYNALLTLLADGGGDSNGVGGLCVGSNTANYEISNNSRILEKWTSQIEKVKMSTGLCCISSKSCISLRSLTSLQSRQSSVYKMNSACAGFT
jgi:hypothetical protein